MSTAASHGAAPDDAVHVLFWADLDGKVLRDGIQDELDLLLSRLRLHCDLTAAICTASNTDSSPFTFSITCMHKQMLAKLSHSSRQRIWMWCSNDPATPRRAACHHIARGCGKGGGGGGGMCLYPVNSIGATVRQQVGPTECTVCRGKQTGPVVPAMVASSHGSMKTTLPSLVFGTIMPRCSGL